MSVESGSWRTAREFATVLSEASVAAKVVSHMKMIGYAADPLYKTGFLNRNYPFRIRKGTLMPEYPVAAQLDAAGYAIRFHCKDKPLMQEQWQLEVQKRIKNGSGK
ncbi:MAG: hypothetical protein AAB573_02680 [Patescibacteria group bacterium]